jgi:hypothetical protein
MAPGFVLSSWPVGVIVAAAIAARVLPHQVWCFIGATILLPLYAAARDPHLLFRLGPVVGIFFAYTGPFGSYFPALYPTRVRNLGAGFCFNVGRGIAAFAPYVLGQLATSIGLSASIALCAAGFFGAAVLMLLMPESGG